MFSTIYVQKFLATSAYNDVLFHMKQENSFRAKSRLDLTLVIASWFREIDNQYNYIPRKEEKLELL